MKYLMFLVVCVCACQFSPWQVEHANHTGILSSFCDEGVRYVTTYHNGLYYTHRCGWDFNQNFWIEKGKLLWRYYNVAV